MLKGRKFKRCPCTYLGCPRKGVCCDCLEYHQGKGELPACYFSREAEKTYDRSIKGFIQDRKQLKETEVQNKVKK